MRWSEIIQSSQPVLEAIAEFDALGREAFLQKYGFGPSTNIFVKHDGKRYDIKALTGAAYGYARPDEGPLKNNTFSSGKPLVDLFQRLGFEVESTENYALLDQAVNFQSALQEFMTGYVEGKSGPFGSTAPMYQVAKRAEAALSALSRDYPSITVRASVGKGNWANVPWIALMDSRITTTTQSGVDVVYLFRADMSGVYVALNQGVTTLKEKLGAAGARQQLMSVAKTQRERFSERLLPTFTTADGIDLRVAGGLGNDYEISTIAWRLYEAGALPSAQEMMADLFRLLDIYDEYASTSDTSSPADTEVPAPWVTRPLSDALDARGFVFAHWQVAAFVHALRTKPFVILAGISGTGKSKLPVLVAELTGARVHLVPVRPDWTDSADLIGYTNLQGAFVPGHLLRVAKAAHDEPDVQHLVVLDEMNLARVEQYFAEVLSVLEDREWGDRGPQSRVPLAPTAPAPWNELRLCANLSIVGTVNMDETTHGFSRKVLDRAFTLEMSDVDLSGWRQRTMAREFEIAQWSAQGWVPLALRPAEHNSLSEADCTAMESVIAALTEVNRILLPAQLQIGYRVRDEIAMFLMHAAADPDGFDDVSPMDLALNMKVLPRIQGGTSAARTVLQRLLLWSVTGLDTADADRVEACVKDWAAAGRPVALMGAQYPRTAARLCLMWERLQSDGFTSYWL